MSLVSVLNAITPLLPSEVTVRIGAKFLKDNSGVPPRIVWVPTRDRFGPTENLQGDDPQLHTCMAGCEAHLWVADYEAGETLRNQVIAACNELYEGSYELGAEAGWLKATEGAVGDLGLVYLMFIAFSVPVLGKCYTRGLVTSIPQTGVLRVGTPPTDSNG